LRIDGIDDLFGGKKTKQRNGRKTNKEYSQTHPNFANTPPRFSTLKGEKVRSLSEKYVADYLFTKKIDYQYEKVLVLDHYTIKPDFYLPAYNVYIEFWGLLDGDKNPQYWKNFRWKTEKYQKHGIKFLPLRRDDLPELVSIFPIKLKLALQGK
jgi:hypothetical protein